MALAFYLLLLFWLLVSYLRMQRTLRWWNQRQSAQLCGEAEQIREGLLQESLAMRRSLELALVDDQEDLSELKQHWLDQIEIIQHSLETFTDYLSPPYVNDSLPLAVQYLLKHWQKTHPGLCLEVDLPTDWDEDAIAQRRILLASLSELLRVIASQPSPGTFLHACLRQPSRSRQLSIQLTTSNVSDLLADAAMELTHLQHAFQVLAAGKCYCQRQGSTVTWYYQWRSP